MEKNRKKKKKYKQKKNKKIKRHKIKNNYKNIITNRIKTNECHQT